MATILLVDDISFIKKIEKKTLENHGHMIVGDAENGVEAVELYEKEKPDIVLMDITMPIMSGLDALKKIIEIDPKARVIMCSALSHEKALMQAITNGARDYLIKPYSMEKLINVIDKVLAH